MHQETIGPYKRTVLAPGEFFVSSEPVVISTHLGSCVAACLFDPVNRVMGMNHFLLSGRTPPSRTPVCLSDAGRYGIHAMELLINGMMQQGASRYNLQAKVFGGSSLIGGGTPAGYRIGENNCRFILEFLALEEIPLLAHDLGGRLGRVIHFCYGNFTVYVRKIRPEQSPVLARRDRQCWISALRKHDRDHAGAELWE